MDRSSTPASPLNLLLPQWRELLQAKALAGLIHRAALEALGLDHEPPQLRELVGQWAAGEFSGLPAVQLLPAASMAGAAGAYALSTGTIYLNADWLQQASAAQVLAVLTEELGHHLDGLLNRSDAPGDEGELFAALLHGDGLISDQQRQRLLAQNDQGSVLLNGAALTVEQAALTSTPIPAASPGRTRGEFSNQWAFAALKADGSVVTWGFSAHGGDSSGVAGRLSSGVSQIFSSYGAFAALKANGSVVTWGSPLYGGKSIGRAGQLSSGVSQIFSSYGAFAALKADGSVVTWGSPHYGADSSAVAGQLSSGVSQIFSTGFAFAALKANGSVVTWGEPYYGGDNSAVAGQLSSGVSQIFSTGFAFAALKANGSVVTWGDPNSGGDSSAVAGQLSSGVSQIFSTDFAFAALKADGSVVTWGDSDWGGDSTGVAGRLNNVVAFANPFTDDRLIDDQLVELWPTITVAGNQLQLQFSEPIVTTGLTTARFVATVNGVPRAIASWAAVPGDPSRLNLTLSGSAPTSTQAVSLRYTDLSAANDPTGVVQDASGNDLATIPPPGLTAATFSSSLSVASLASAYANLTLIGTATTATGNSGNNLIRASQPTAVRNVFNGGPGIDAMDAAAGSDIYLIPNATEHSAAEIRDSGTAASDIDELRFSDGGGSTAVANDTLTVFAGDTGLERVSIGRGTAAQPDTSSTAALSINAANAPNRLTLIGNNGPNALTGTAFNDLLIGNRGNDSLTGGDGGDTFRFDSTLNATTNRDTITDFVPSLDRIQLENSVFSALRTPGPLAASAFRLGSAATTSAHRIIYNNLTGTLTYDSNGVASGGSTIFAALSAGLGTSMNATLFSIT
jgi:Ca2+-binding RTX toxin-like protein